MIVEVVKPDRQLYTKFNSLLKQGNVIVLYYANWCPHCINMKPEWDAFKTKCNSDPKYSHLKVAEVESEHIANTNATTEAQGFPTIKFYKKNNTSNNIPTEVVDFQEERTADNLLKFTENNTIEEVVEKKIANNNITNNTDNNKGNNKSKKNKKGKKARKVKNITKPQKTKKSKLLKGKKLKRKETAKLRDLVFGKK